MQDTAGQTNYENSKDRQKEHREHKRRTDLVLRRDFHEIARGGIGINSTNPSGRGIAWVESPPGKVVGVALAFKPDDLSF